MKNRQEVNGIKFNEKDEKDLIILERIKKGDVDAYNVIYKRYYRFIQHQCFLSVRDYHMSKDMASDILTKIFLNIDKYSVRYTFNSWVTSIVNNYIIDRVRKSKTDPLNLNKNAQILNYDISKFNIEEDGMNVVFSSGMDSGYKNPEEILSEKGTDKMRKKFVLNLLAGLKETERQIMIHYYFDGMSYEEISSKMNMGLSKMKVTLMRTKEKLRRKIGTKDNIYSLLAA